MNAYRFKTTVSEGGMIFFPFHYDLPSNEVEVIIVPQDGSSKKDVADSQPVKGSFSQMFSKSRGMWQDYDIDGARLRDAAWERNEKTAL
jgi:hypothetical protein